MSAPTPDPRKQPLAYYHYLKQVVGYSHSTAYLAVLSWIVPEGNAYWRRIRRWADYRRRLEQEESEE